MIFRYRSYDFPGFSKGNRTVFGNLFASPNRQGRIIACLKPAVFCYNTGCTNPCPLSVQVFKTLSVYCHETSLWWRLCWDHPKKGDKNISPCASNYLHWPKCVVWEEDRVRDFETQKFKNCICQCLSFPYSVNFQVSRFKPISRSGFQVAISKFQVSNQDPGQDLSCSFNWARNSVIKAWLRV